MNDPADHRPVLRTSSVWTPEDIEDIQVKAELGRYRLRGFGALRPRPLPKARMANRATKGRC